MSRKQTNQNEKPETMKEIIETGDAVQRIVPKDAAPEIGERVTQYDTGHDSEVVEVNPRRKKPIRILDKATGSYWWVRKTTLDEYREVAEHTEARLSDGSRCYITGDD